jgi:hypothetical protein
MFVIVPELPLAEVLAEALPAELGEELADELLELLQALMRIAATARPAARGTRLSRVSCIVTTPLWGGWPE